MASLIILAMRNFTITCFILGLLCAFLACLQRVIRSGALKKEGVIERIFPGIYYSISAWPIYLIL